MAEASTSGIYKALANIMSEIGAIGKDRTNSGQGFKFRGIEDMYNAAHPLLVKYGVIVLTESHEPQVQALASSSGKGKLSVVARISHHFVCVADGSFLTATTLGEGMDPADKSSYKAQSGALKYAIAQTLMIPFADVEDADRAGADESDPLDFLGATKGAT